MSLKFAGGVGFFGMVLLACGGGVSLGDANQGLNPDQGTSGTTSSSGSTSGATQKDCSARGACGPALGMPAQMCSDGSLGGNTGRCLANGSGGCAWEIRTCPSDAGAPVCFDDKGELEASFKQCNPASASPVAECVTVAFQQNCCGTSRVAGVNRNSQAAAQTCGDDRGKTFPACGCAMQGPVADDGTHSADGTMNGVTVTCTAAGLCETSFNSADPCAGQTLPACPADCSTFPMTGSCTAGDRCRLKGSTIGDECSCNGGTWACSPHPPLGTGCNQVCR